MTCGKSEVVIRLQRYETVLRRECGALEAEAETAVNPFKTLGTARCILQLCNAFPVLQASKTLGFVTNNGSCFMNSTYQYIGKKYRPTYLGALRCHAKVPKQRLSLSHNLTHRIQKKRLVLTARFLLDPQRRKKTPSNDRERCWGNHSLDILPKLNRPTKSRDS